MRTSVLSGLMLRITFFLQFLGFSARKNSRFFFEVHQKVYKTKLFKLFKACCLMQYFKRQRKSRKHLKSQDTCYQQDFHNAFTILLNVQIKERELTSGKIST